MKYTLVILAAGIGSRFGGVKQLEPVGPGGEIIIDYTVRDAVEAGFEKIVFLIRDAIDQDFREAVGRRIEARCRAKGVEAVYAYQRSDALPEGFACPQSRTKPWGTGHALLCCRDKVDGPFAVCNADDYYGKQGFRDILAHLKSRGDWCLSGYRLGNTLSCFGGVTRGICRVDERGTLLSVTETRNIRAEDLGVSLDPEAVTSMNLWGFTPALFDCLQEGFVPFLQENLHDSSAEYLLPEVVDTALRQHKATVQVIANTDRWFGMTYREDIPIVKEALKDERF